MKIKTWVETEAEVNVSAEDFMAEMSQLPDDEMHTTMLNAITIAYGVLQRVPDKVIAQMTDGQRRLIHEALTLECARYK